MPAVVYMRLLPQPSRYSLIAGPKLFPAAHSIRINPMLFLPDTFLTMVTLRIES